jgi:hypothetical protein
MAFQELCRSRRLKVGDMQPGAGQTVRTRRGGKVQGDEISKSKSPKSPSKEREVGNIGKKKPRHSMEQMK